MTELPLLFSFRRCPYAIRARLALAVSGIAHTVHEVSLRNKPPALHALSPKATVPVLVLQHGEVIDQSLAIMQWALAQNDPDGWLETVKGAHATPLALVNSNDSTFKHHLDRFKYPHRYAQELRGESKDELAEFALHHRAGCAQWITVLETHLVQGYLGGTRIGFADMALLPFVRQCAHTDTGWFAATSWPRVHRWLAEFEASALFKKVMVKATPCELLSNK